MYLRKMVHVVVKTCGKSIVKKQINELATMMDTLYLTDKDGKPIGSGWKIQTINKLCVDIFQTRDLRGSSYIETPSKLKNAKCRLVNIQNNDQQCFKYCLLYHQSEKINNYYTVIALTKIEDKYSYADISFPVCYADIDTFLIINLRNGS